MAHPSPPSINPNNDFFYSWDSGTLEALEESMRGAMLGRHTMADFSVDSLRVATDLLTRTFPVPGGRPKGEYGLVIMFYCPNPPEGQIGFFLNRLSMTRYDHARGAEGVVGLMGYAGFTGLRGTTGFGGYAIGGVTGIGPGIGVTGIGPYDPWTGSTPPDSTAIMANRIADSTATMLTSSLPQTPTPIMSVGVGINNPPSISMDVNGNTRINGDLYVTGRVRRGRSAVERTLELANGRPIPPAGHVEGLGTIPWYLTTELFARGWNTLLILGRYVRVQYRRVFPARVPGRGRYDLAVGQKRHQFRKFLGTLLKAFI